MKKFFHMAVVAIAALLSSCQKDDLEGNSVSGGEVDFRISASLPTGIKTYASGSGGGGVSNVGADYTLRYTCEAWTKETTPRRAWRDTLTTNDFSDEVKFSARLVAMNYDFVFWADFVDKDDKVDLFYNTNNLTGLQDIEVLNAGLSNDARDAFYASKEVNLTQEGQTITGVFLTRPFGKVRLVASDQVDGTLPDRPKLAKITYVQSSLPGGFNALAKSTTGRTLPVSGAYISVPVQETIGGVNAYVLSFDYILASSSQPAIALNVKTFSDVGGNTQMGSKDISAIPVQANKLTTVIGNLYTSNGALGVSVTDAFDPDNLDVSVTEVTSITDITPTLLQSNPIVKVLLEVTGSPNIAIPVFPIGTTAPTYISLDLSAGIATGSILSISDAASYSGTFAVTVPDGSAGDLQINLPNAHVIIYGSYGNIISQTSPTTLVVAEGAEVSILTVEKGNVEIRGTVSTLSVNSTDSVGTIKVFSTATVTNIGNLGSYKVHWGASTGEGLRTALAKPAVQNHGAFLERNISYTVSDPMNGASANQDAFKIYTSEGRSNFYDSTDYDGYVLDGNGYTLSGLAYNNVLAVYAHNTTIKNLTITQTGARANAGMSIYRSTDTKLIDVTVKNCGKAGVVVNAATATATGLTVSGCTWGGVNVTKGGAPSGGNKPEFKLVNGTFTNQDLPIYVSLGTTSDDYLVTVPAGWTHSTILGNEVYASPM